MDAAATRASPATILQSKHIKAGLLTPTTTPPPGEPGASTLPSLYAPLSIGASARFSTESGVPKGVHADRSPLLGTRLRPAVSCTADTSPAAPRASRTASLASPHARSAALSLGPPLPEHLPLITGKTIAEACAPGPDAQGKPYPNGRSVVDPVAAAFEAKPGTCSRASFHALDPTLERETRRYDWKHEALQACTPLRGRYHADADAPIAISPAAYALDGGSVGETPPSPSILLPARTNNGGARSAAGVTLCTRALRSGRVTPTTAARAADVAVHGDAHTSAAPLAGGGENEEKENSCSVGNSPTPRRAARSARASLTSLPSNHANAAGSAGSAAAVRRSSKKGAFVLHDDASLRTLPHDVSMSMLSHQVSNAPSSTPASAQNPALGAFWPDSQATAPLSSPSHPTSRETSTNSTTAHSSTAVSTSSRDNALSGEGAPHLTRCASVDPAVLLSTPPRRTRTSGLRHLSGWRASDRARGSSALAVSLVSAAASSANWQLSPADSAPLLSPEGLRGAAIVAGKGVCRSGEGGLAGWTPLRAKFESRLAASGAASGSFSSLDDAADAPHTAATHHAVDASASALTQRRIPLLDAQFTLAMACPTVLLQPRGHSVCYDAEDYNAEGRGAARSSARVTCREDALLQAAAFHVVRADAPFCAQQLPNGSSASSKGPGLPLKGGAAGAGGAFEAGGASLSPLAGPVTQYSQYLQMLRLPTAETRTPLQEHCAPFSHTLPVTRTSSVGSCCVDSCVCSRRLAELFWCAQWAVESWSAARGKSSCRAAKVMTHETSQKLNQFGRWLESGQRGGEGR